MLNPGTRVLVRIGTDEFIATYERGAGGDDVIVRTQDGQRLAIEGRFITPQLVEVPPRDGLKTK